MASGFRIRALRSSSEGTQLVLQRAPGPLVDGGILLFAALAVALGAGLSNTQVSIRCDRASTPQCTITNDLHETHSFVLTPKTRAEAEDGTLAIHTDPSAGPLHVAATAKVGSGWANDTAGRLNEFFRNVGAAPLNLERYTWPLGLGVAAPFVLIIALMIVFRRRTFRVHLAREGDRVSIVRRDLLSTAHLSVVASRADALEVHKGAGEPQIILRSEDGRQIALTPSMSRPEDLDRVLEALRTFLQPER